MLELEKLLYALRASTKQEEEARNISASAIQRIKEIVGPAIDICNNDPDCRYAIDDFEISLNQTRSGLVLNVNSLTNHGNGQRIHGKSLNFETSKPFEEKVGEILTKILEKQIRVVIDS